MNFALSDKHTLLSSRPNAARSVAPTTAGAAHAYQLEKYMLPGEQSSTVHRQWSTVVHASLLIDEDAPPRVNFTRNFSARPLWTRFGLQANIVQVVLLSALVIAPWSDLVEHQKLCQTTWQCPSESHKVRSPGDSNGQLNCVVARMTTAPS